MRYITICIVLFSFIFANEPGYYGYFLQGHAAEATKNYTAALNAYQHAITLEPGFAPAYNAFGFIHLELTHYVESRTYFEKALQLDPQFVVPLLNIGASYYREGDFANAQKYFLLVLEKEPNHPKALTNMAVVKYRYGDYFGAWYYYSQAKKADEAYLKERYNKEKTLAELRAARKKDPDNMQLKLLEEKVKREEIYLP